MYPTQTSYYSVCMIYILFYCAFYVPLCFQCMIQEFMLLNPRILFMCCRFREKLGVKTVKALKRNNNGVTHAAIDMLCALMCVSPSINI